MVAADVAPAWPLLLQSLHSLDAFPPSAGLQSHPSVGTQEGQGDPRQDQGLQRKSNVYW